MIVERNQIFNLMDTNGRRSDVLNALKIYLEILEELKEMYPTEGWGTYPSSLTQFSFYELALEKSKDVFKIHKNYDEFISHLGDNYQTFMSRDREWVENNMPSFARTLDEAIEKRARHYTSNLVKMGFTNGDRIITEAGYSYLRGFVVRDDLEEILPLDNINISLLRQLTKLKIFTTCQNGKRQYYSPFIMALVLLLSDATLDMHAFEVIVQGLNPYCDTKIKKAISAGSINITRLVEAVCDIDIVIPDILVGKGDIPYNIFRDIFKGSKNNEETSRIYYAFFCALRDFRNNKSEKNYAKLLDCFDAESVSVINKAFGYGKTIFECGSRGSRYTLSRFIKANAAHPLLTTTDYVDAFYATFFMCKRADGIREYSDTTVRLLSATGLFKFRNLPELSYKEVLSLIFNIDNLRQNVFGEMTEEEYNQYEESQDCYFGKSLPLSQILNYSPAEVSTITRKLEALLGVSAAKDVKATLVTQKNTDFIAHIHEKYSREKIMELLPLFSDRSKDSQIKKAVNDAATVPTIYEYIIGIAWYYISNEEFDLYNSLNLTLNADFEPVIHAGGGDGDIVAHYDDIIVMLEVTLMNKQAQKRGEWEPVLRHSLNLKAENEPKETITFFIADELDHNTINIWRAVAAASLESTNTHEKVTGVTIMPFVNSEILWFLEKNIYYKDIVSAVKRSFADVPIIPDTQWRQEIMYSLS